MNVKALSIRQPWAWLILHAGKDVENRTWATHFRCRVLIHASKGMTRQEYDEACWFMGELDIDYSAMPLFGELERGGIVGEVEIVDCVTESDSPWFAGPHGFVLRNAKSLPFQPCKGALGFFNAEHLEGYLESRRQSSTLNPQPSA